MGRRAVALAATAAPALHCQRELSFFLLLRTTRGGVGAKRMERPRGTLPSQYAHRFCVVVESQSPHVSLATAVRPSTLQQSHTSYYSRHTSTVTLLLWLRGHCEHTHTMNGTTWGYHPHLQLKNDTASCHQANDAFQCSLVGIHRCTSMTIDLNIAAVFYSDEKLYCLLKDRWIILHPVYCKNLTSESIAFHNLNCLINMKHLIFRSDCNMQHYHAKLFFKNIAISRII